MTDPKPDLKEKTGINKLLEVMAALRDPKTGCMWDVAQRFATITKYTLEEVYEVVDAIERQDMESVREELGDLLFQIVFYAQMAREQGLFDFNELAEAAAGKMIGRHPHVFSGMKLEDVEALMKAWESEKAKKREKKAREEGRPPSLLDDVGSALPSLSRAVKLQSRAARGGFEWKTPAPVYEKLAEELAELKEMVELREKTQEPLPLELVDRLTEELGDVLFVVAALGRTLKIDPELALRQTNRKFERRFRSMEKSLAASGRKPGDVSPEELGALWEKERAKDKGYSKVK